MGWDKSHDDYKNVYQNGEPPENTASHGHEAIAGGAAYAAFKAFEKHQRKDGKKMSHPHAKGLIASLAGAEVDKLAETKGADAWDKEKAKHEAKKQADELYDEHYGGHDDYDPSSRPSHRYLQDDN